MQNKPLIIGIAGGSASGKSSIAKKLEAAFDGKKVIKIKEDDYYNDQKDMTMQERLLVNYDHPFAFDHKFLIEQLTSLIDGNPIDKPTYDYVNNTRSEVTERIESGDVIILEGLFVLEDEEIRKLLDIKIFVDTPPDVRFIRRLKRDVKERGRSIDSVINQYLNVVRLMHDQFIEPSKKYADLIIPEGGHNVVAIDLLITKISSIIN